MMMVSDMAATTITAFPDRIFVEQTNIAVGKDKMTSYPGNLKSFPFVAKFSLILAPVMRMDAICDRAPAALGFVLIMGPSIDLVNEAVQDICILSDTCGTAQQHK
jgi:hypothetical protein